MGGQITGEYHRTSQFVFNDNNERFEKITYFPLPTLTELSVTQEDLEDLGGVQPFALEASKLAQYDFKYFGKERLDELDTYVFDVAPKIVPKKVSERFFQGRIWVDQQDLQIVKVRGKGVPEGNQRFPVFETYRQQVDGHYWFPTYTFADDELIFPKGELRASTNGGSLHGLQTLPEQSEDCGCRRFRGTQVAADTHAGAKEAVTGVSIRWNNTSPCYESADRSGGDFAAVATVSLADFWPRCYIDMPLK